MPTIIQLHSRTISALWWFPYTFFYTTSFKFAEFYWVRRTCFVPWWKFLLLPSSQCATSSGIVQQSMNHNHSQWRNGKWRCPDHFCRDTTVHLLPCIVHSNKVIRITSRFSLRYKSTLVVLQELLNSSVESVTGCLHITCKVFGTLLAFDTCECTKQRGCILGHFRASSPSFAILVTGSSHTSPSAYLQPNRKISSQNNKSTSRSMKAVAQESNQCPSAVSQ